MVLNEQWAIEKTKWQMKQFLDTNECETHYRTFWIRKIRDIHSTKHLNC
jgi:hypothetical protein